MMTSLNITALHARPEAEPGQQADGSARNPTNFGVFQQQQVGSFDDVIKKFIGLSSSLYKTNSRYMGPN